MLGGGEGKTCDVEVRLRDKKGDWRHVSVKLTNRVDDASISGAVLNLTDVTERRAHEQQLTHQALHDPLTGLANRRLFLERLDTTTIERRKGDPSTHSLIYIDFDDFKQINDTLGHKAGDDFLAAMAQRLIECVRPEDLVARLGGDEYAVLLKDTERHDAVVIVERMMTALAVKWTAWGKEIRPHASVGVVSRSDDSTTAETLLGDGDLAMYFAKRQGKARYEVYSETMRTELLERLKLGEDLRAAVEEATLAVQYQPIIDMRSGAMSGVEALARWQHPTRGWIPPNTFIPLAEEIGLVNQIDMWVLHEACRQGRTWRDEGLGDLRIAVNLSGSDLESPGLVGTVAQTLQETGFPAAMLELELTEGVAIFESASARETLQSLKGLGVRLAIDDFGTGYSALGRLRSLPFDRLKVDKAFVDELSSAHDGTTWSKPSSKWPGCWALKWLRRGSRRPSRLIFSVARTAVSRRATCTAGRSTRRSSRFYSKSSGTWIKLLVASCQPPQRSSATEDLAGHHRWLDPPVGRGQPAGNLARPKPPAERSAQIVTAAGIWRRRRAGDMLALSACRGPAGGLSCRESETAPAPITLSQLRATRPSAE